MWHSLPHDIVRHAVEWYRFFCSKMSLKRAGVTKTLISQSNSQILSKLTISMVQLKEVAKDSLSIESGKLAVTTISNWTRFDCVKK